MSEYKSIANRVIDIGVKTDSFIPEGQTETITYKRLVIVEMIGGEEMPIEVKVDKTELQLMQAGSVLDNADLLDNDLKAGDVVEKSK